MSVTTILDVYPCERVEEHSELRNSWGSAIIIWERIWDKYGVKRFEYDGCLTAGDRLWDLQHHPRLSHAERVLFCLTFDRAYVVQADYLRLAADIDDFFDGAPEGHWPAIRDHLRSHDAPATGFYWTSVAENPFLGEWNEEDEDYAPIDWSTTFNVYDLVAEIETGGEPA